MKKKLGKLNKKIRHSKRKHNNLISKQNSIKKKIEELTEPREPNKPEESFNPIEIEQAFNSYRINGRSRMDVDTFFDRIRQNLIDLMNREVKDLGSARVQTTAWIKFRVEVEDENGNIIGVNRVDKAFNSRMTEIFQGSDLNEIVSEMLAHMKMQIENPALANSRFMFNEVPFLDVNFHQLNLTRGSSYIPLPSWIASNKAVINPKNENDEKCFEWAVTAALHHEEIGKNPQRRSNIMRYANNYNWSGLEFPVAINKMNEFEKNNNISVNVLGIKGQKPNICRKLKYNRKNIDLLLIADGEKRHYTVIKSRSRLLGSSNSKDEHQQNFCLNCLQGFHSEESRDNHFEYCKDNEAVKIEMPKEGSFVEFHDGQKRFKVPFTMYMDFEQKNVKSIFKPEESYTKKINQHIPSGFYVYSKFALKLYSGEDCVEAFCNYIENEVKRLYHMFPEKPMKHLNHEGWREFNRVTKCHICFKGFKEDNPRLEITVITLANIEDLPTGTAIKDIKSHHISPLYPTI